MKKLFFFLAVALPCFVFTAYGNEVNVIPETSGAGSKVVNNTGKTNGHEWVDLGLPSGVLWATCNVGASSPEDYGDYFAWGETSPKDDFGWSNYKFGRGKLELTKYCSSMYHEVDNKATLDPEDDAAYVNWGSTWRMPTRAEQDELRAKCTWTWTTLNGVEGCKVTSRSNGNFIFLPATGYRSGDSFYTDGYYGHYWSCSSPVGSLSDNAFILRFYHDSPELSYSDRAIGYSVRPVRPAYGNDMNVIPETSEAGKEIGNNTGITNGHEWVDLGLPSGIRWATCNVGASSPEDYGDYFAWGETSPKDDFRWSNYKYGRGERKLTKYCRTSSFGYNGFTDNKTTLDPEDDAAHVNWGGNWRIPTQDEVNEIVKECTKARTTQNGVFGLKLTGPNGNSIFLPAAGHCYDGSFYRPRFEGYYWANSNGSYQGSASCLSFSRVPENFYITRYYGLSVRAVCQ